jgi:hypothetical protein
MGTKTIRSTTCKFGGQVIGIDEALEIRSRSGRIPPDFRCVECDERVKAFKKSVNGNTAHFEHQSRNAACSLSVAHPSRNV